MMEMSDGNNEIEEGMQVNAVRKFEDILWYR